MGPTSQVLAKIQVLAADPGHTSTCEYSQVPTSTQRINSRTTCINYMYYAISMSVSRVPPTTTSLTLSRLPFSLKALIISFRGTASGKVHQEPKTDAARVDSSESECRIL